MKKLGGVDVRADGGQVVYAARSTPKPGSPTWWADGFSPNDISLAPFPGELLARLRERLPAPRVPPPPPCIARWVAEGRFASYVEAALHHAVGRIVAAAPGTRNQVLNRETYGIARIVAAGALPHDAAAAALMDAALRAGLPEREAFSTLRSAMRAGCSQPVDLVPSTRRRFAHARPRRRQ